MPPAYHPLPTGEKGVCFCAHGATVSIAILAAEENLAMKQLLTFCFAVLLAAGSARAQSGHDMSGHDDQKKDHDHQAAAGHDQMGAMHEKMMKEMQADMDGMKANLQKMKDLSAKTNDPAAKEQLQLNISMWQSMIGNMEKHMHMMNTMHEHGMGMGQGHGSGEGHEAHGKDMGSHDLHSNDMHGKEMHGHEMGEKDGPGMSCCGGGKDGMSCGKGDGKEMSGCCCKRASEKAPPPDATKKP
jgi:hypothetical protein